MNMFTGSLQRKGRRYYLVLTAHGRQKRIALKTTRLDVARRRAAYVSPRDAADEEGWLRQLVRLGEAARLRLDRRRPTAPVSWHNLWKAFCARTPTPVPAASAASYRRWLEILSEAAPPHRPPSTLTAEETRQVAAGLRARYVSAPRLVVFFRRVWRTLGWDAAVWAQGACAAARGTSPAHEFYRRLETEEVQCVLRAFAARGGDPLARAYADMVVVGYYTGLRLSDVAELERDEVVSGGLFLSLQPNKTRHSKRRRVRVPLVGLAGVCVRRRLAHPADGTFLFPAQARRRPSKAICRAFRDCGVLPHGQGRASFHSLRATFISLMDEAGIPPHVTDAITGHAGGGGNAGCRHRLAFWTRGAVVCLLAASLAVAGCRDGTRDAPPAGEPPAIDVNGLSLTGSEVEREIAFRLALVKFRKPSRRWRTRLLERPGGGLPRP